MTLEMVVADGVFREEIKRFTFPGGEVGIKIHTNLKEYNSVSFNKLICKITSSNDFMALALTKDDNDNFILHDRIESLNDPLMEKSLLQPVFHNGRLLVDQKLSDIRNRVLKGI